MSRLPKGWVEVPLGTFATTTKNVDPAAHAATQFELYSVPAYATGAPDLVTGAEIGSTKQVVEPDDVLLCKIIPHLNRVWSVPEPADRPQIASPEWLVYRDHGCEPNYLRGALSEASFRERFLKTKSGVGGSLTRARTSLVNEIAIAIAPLPEQRRIVAKVDALTARTARARADLSRIPTLIARYKQRLLALAFSGELTAVWRKDHDLAGPDFKQIDELAEGLRYGTAQKCYEEPQGVAVLRIPNVSSGRLNLDDLKYTELPPKEFEKLELRVGDLLVVRSNGSADLVGRPALVAEKAAGMAYAGYLIRIRPRTDLVVPKFLALMLEAPMTRGIFQASARSTNGIHNVNAKELGALPIPLFAITEQAEIVRRIESAFGWLDRIAADHAAAARLIPKLDAAILTKAFRGDLVPQDPDDEPASVLLERVRAERAAAPVAKRGRKVHHLEAPGIATAPLELVSTPRPRQPKASAMPKSRQDDDVRDQPYLAGKLKGLPRADVQTLFRAADLPVADFYKQLAWEIGAGHIVDDPRALNAA